MTISTHAQNTAASTLAQITNASYTVNPTNVIGGYSYNPNETDNATAAALVLVNETNVNYSEITDLSHIHPQIWTNSSGDRIIVYRGTADLQDAVTDGQLIDSATTAELDIPPAFREAQAFLQAAAPYNFTGNVIVTGHSLGGAEALYATGHATEGLYSGDYALNIDAVVFNPPGLTQEMINEIHPDLNPDDIPAITILAQGDPVSQVTVSMGHIIPGETIIVAAGPTSVVTFGFTVTVY